MDNSIDMVMNDPNTQSNKSVDKLIDMIMNIDLNSPTEQFKILMRDSSESSMRYEIEVSDQPAVFYNDENINKCYLVLDETENEITYDEYDKLVFITDAYHLQNLFITELSTHDSNDVTLELCLNISNDIMNDEYGDDWTKEEMYRVMYKHSLKPLITDMIDGIKSLNNSES